MRGAAAGADKEPAVRVKSTQAPSSLGSGGIEGFNALMKGALGGRSPRAVPTFGGGEMLSPKWACQGAWEWPDAEREELSGRHFSRFFRVGWGFLSSKVLPPSRMYMLRTSRWF